MAVLGLRFCARAFSSCGKRGPLFIAVCGPLTIAASLVAEHRLQTRRLSNCGSQAQLLRGMWDLPRPGLEPVFPTLAGRFSTTAPPEKPQPTGFKRHLQNSPPKTSGFLIGIRQGATCAFLLPLQKYFLNPNQHMGYKKVLFVFLYIFSDYITHHI